jgi:archaemetzincin
MKIIKQALILSLFSLPLFSPDVGLARSVDERVYIVPAGPVDQKIVTALKERLPGCLPMAAKAVIEPPKDLPHAAYDAARNQYNAETMLGVLSRRVVIGEAMERALFVVDVDLYSSGPDPVFGLADPKKGACIISLARLRNEFYGLKPDNRLFIDRVVKEAVRELGRTYGIDGCSDRRCVMFSSGNLPGDDKKRDTFCVECRIKLRKRYGGSIIGPVLPK